MAAPIRVAGIATFKRDGAPYALRGTLTIQPLNTKKEAVIGVDGFHGYKEEPIAAYIEAEVTVGSFSVKALQGVTNSTITAELPNGTVYALRQAFFAGESSIDAGDGKVKIRFEGAECVEV